MYWKMRTVVFSWQSRIQGYILYKLKERFHGVFGLCSFTNRPHRPYGPPRYTLSKLFLIQFWIRGYVLKKNMNQRWRRYRWYSISDVPDSANAVSALSETHSCQIYVWAVSDTKKNRWSSKTLCKWMYKAPRLWKATKVFHQTWN